jgi:ectoine hydroxylase-related dioxygenase (phytanoyl-CoA dioxygenase family)
MKSISSPLELHGGGTPYSAYGYYNFKDNRFFCGFTVASFTLTDAPPGTGGFCCIPDSHKSNLPLPAEFTDLDNPADCIVQVPARRGDVILFPEALTHGSLSWKGDHERRALLFKYCPRHILQESGPPSLYQHYEWEEHQRDLLRSPYLRGNS